MLILQYFDRPDEPSLPNPRGILSDCVPTAAIVSANAEVRCTMQAARRTKSRGPYNAYLPEQRATMGKYTAKDGVMAATMKQQQRTNDEHKVDIFLGR